MSMENRLKDACQERCAGFGEPACWEICKDEPDARDWDPCAECLEECGIKPGPEPRDPNAAIGDMFE